MSDAVTDDLIARLIDSKEFRDRFMAETVQQSIAAQVLALRRQHGLTSEGFADKAGISYATVSRLENPRAGQYCRIDALLKIASAFDVALIIKFVAFSRWLAEYFVVTPDGVRLYTPETIPTCEETLAELEAWAAAGPKGG